MTASLTATDRNIKTPRLRAPWQSPQCTEPLLLPILSSSSPAKRCTTPLRPAVASPRHDHSPPPRLSADTAPKRRSSPDKLPHCLMQTVTARHVKFIRKLRIYIRNLRLYIQKFRLYIRNLRLYFAIGDSEVYVQCPGSLPALPAGLQTVTAGNMCIAGRVADRSAALARRGKKPENGRMWVMPPAVQRTGIHGMDIMHRDTGLRQDDRRLPHGTTACLNSICVAVCAAYFVTASSNRSMVTGHCSPVTISLSVMVPAASSSLPTMTTNGMCLVSA